MSLMFAALRRLDAPAQAPRAPAPARAGRRWPAMALPAGLVACAFAAGWWLAPAHEAAAPRQVAQAVPARPSRAVTPAAPASMPVVAAPATRPVPAPTPLQAQARDVRVAQPSEDLAHAPSGARAAGTETEMPRVAAAAARPHPIPARSAGEPAGAPAAPQPAAPARPSALADAPSPAPLPQDGLVVRDASSTGEGGEGRAIAREVAAIGDAINGGDFDAARARLQALAGQLPPRSLTLMRMQAWLAHESGDTAAALALYREIVARVPGDRTSVVNLAILEAANGETDKARERLRRLREVDSGSLEVQRAIARVEAELR
ncbi:MAG TPA: tetratricopeptide repeat protein [Xanthomonadaceae bacterium]|nr:tetratricopeptide repeat protein [Xanthomonadaceae bacterium]